MFDQTNGDTLGEAMPENANGSDVVRIKPVKTHLKASLDYTTFATQSIADNAVTTGVTADSELATMLLLEVAK